MSKTKTPYHSFGASGTIADTITAQKLGGITILRKTPIPLDRRTFLQNYQRWDYNDASFYWKTLTYDVKFAYRAAASRTHVSIYSAFLRYYLKRLPDLLARWHFDSPLSEAGLDSSKNSNNGTIFGCTVADGLINNALSFDGLDDRLNVPYHSSLYLLPPYTIEFFVYFNNMESGIYICRRSKNFQVYTRSNDELGFYFTGSDGPHETLNLNIVPDRWYHLAVVFNDSDNSVKFYSDGILNVTRAETKTPQTDNIDLTIGSSWSGAPPGNPEWIDGFLDHLTFYNRALSPEQILLHSRRRYPQ